MVKNQKDVVFIDLSNPDQGQCLSNLCLNGGTCIQKGKDYNCTCAPGYEGDNCEIGRIMYHKIHFKLRNLNYILHVVIKKNNN